LIEIEKREHIEAGAVVQNMLKKGQHAGMPEQNEFFDELLDKCTMPRLRKIKQVEVYTPWRKFVQLK
jgi:hypothetical protein